LTCEFQQNYSPSPTCAWLAHFLKIQKEKGVDISDYQTSNGEKTKSTGDDGLVFSEESLLFVITSQSSSLPYRTHRHRKTEVEEDAELLKNNEEEDTTDSNLIFTESPACKS
jgi:hypothetical protein